MGDGQCTPRHPLRIPSVIVLGAILAGCFGGGGGSGETSPGAGGGPGSDADLLLSAVDFTPTAVEAGETILTADTVRNDGSQAVGEFRVGVYLSPDPLVTTEDLLLGYRTVGGLTPGQESSGGGGLTIPLTTAPGTYRVGAIADDLGAVGERDETNNSLVDDQPLQVSAPTLANLVAAAVDFTPLDVDAGDTIDVQEQIANQGQATAEGFQVGIYLSSDPVLTTSDVLLGFRVVTSLDPGSVSQASATLTVPMGTFPGVYHLGAIVDDTDVVPESDELDNVLVATSTLTVQAPDLPDLVPTHVAFTPAAVDAGQPIQVSEGVLNQGTGAASGFQVAVFLSSDLVLDSGDVLLGFRVVGWLDPGQESQVIDLPLEIPPDTSAGTYFVGVVADDTEVAPETNEANNGLLAMSALTVSVPPLPDLLPERIDYSPAVVNVDQGDLLHLDEFVRNVGVEAAGSFRVGVYLSPNSSVSPSDLLIASRVVTALDPDAGSGAAADVQLPSGIGDGSYYVGVVVDDLQQQNEIGEGNNVLVAGGLLDVVSTPDPKPNLVMIDVTYSGNRRRPGDTFQVVTEVKNIGNLSAPPFHVGVYLSVDELVTPDDILLGERFLLTGLGAGFTSVASAPVTIPTDTPEGFYTVGAYADSHLAVGESDEQDNATGAIGKLEVYFPRPDLQVSSASHDGDVVNPGDLVTLDDSILNGGELDAGPFRVGYYLSTDASIAADDVLLASRVVASLSIGGEDTASTPLTIPSGTASGTYWLGILVDDLGQVEESDEGNNDRTVLPQITVP